MKIHSNPNFPQRAQQRGALRDTVSESSDFLSQLAARNAKELERLREKQRDSSADISEAKAGPRSHVHRVRGHVRAVKQDGKSHSHRFRTVTGPAIPCSGGHVHELQTTTAPRNGHCHKIRIKTGPPIHSGKGQDGGHVHRMEGLTAVNEPLGEGADSSDLLVGITEIAD